MEINLDLKKYIENEVLPVYSKNDDAHDISHIDYVIKRSSKFASIIPDINYDMVYVISAFHDIGHHIDRKNHEKVSADILLKDKGLKVFFDDNEINIMAEAVEDHRASLEYVPRSIYGKIVSSADRNTSVDIFLQRTYAYTLKHSLNSSLDDIVEESRLHILDKFGSDGYAREKMFFEDLEYIKFLKDITILALNIEEFNKKYYEVNSLNK